MEKILLAKVIVTGNVKNKSVPTVTSENLKLGLSE